MIQGTVVCKFSLNSRVAFFEPAKFVAKLRCNKTDNNLLILRVDDVGHGGSAGQYSYLEVK